MTEPKSLFADVHMGDPLYGDDEYNGHFPLEGGLSAEPYVAKRETDLPHALASTARGE